MVGQLVVGQLVCGSGQLVRGQLVARMTTTTQNWLSTQIFTTGPSTYQLMAAAPGGRRKQWRHNVQLKAPGRKAIRSDQLSERLPAAEIDWSPARTRTQGAHAGQLVVS